MTQMTKKWDIEIAQSHYLQHHFWTNTSAMKTPPLAIRQNCGVNVGMVDLMSSRATSNDRPHRSRRQCAHGGLIRNVALSADFQL